MVDAENRRLQQLSASLVARIQYLESLLTDQAPSCKAISDHNFSEMDEISESQDQLISENENENDSSLLDQDKESSCSEVIQTAKISTRKRESKLLGKLSKWTSDALEKLSWGLLSHGNDWESL